MLEPSVDERFKERVFRVMNGPLYGIAFLLALCAILPVMSLHELITTGTIDMDAVGKGRRETPTWMAYLIGWFLFLSTLLIYRPIIRYVLDGEMFRLNQQGIVIRDTTLTPEEVLGFSPSILLRGYVLHSTRGDFSIHPRISDGAMEALAEAFPHVQLPK